MVYMLNRVCWNIPSIHWPTQIAPRNRTRKIFGPRNGLNKTDSKGNWKAKNKPVAKSGNGQTEMNVGRTKNILNVTHRPCGLVEWLKNHRLKSSHFNVLYWRNTVKSSRTESQFFDWYRHITGKYAKSVSMIRKICLTASCCSFNSLLL